MANKQKHNYNNIVGNDMILLTAHVVLCAIPIFIRDFLLSSWTNSSCSRCNIAWWKKETFSMLTLMLNVVMNYYILWKRDGRKETDRFLAHLGPTFEPMFSSERDFKFWKFLKFNIKKDDVYFFMFREAVPHLSNSGKKAFWTIKCLLLK